MDDGSGVLGRFADRGFSLFTCLFVCFLLEQLNDFDLFEDGWNEMEVLPRSYLMKLFLAAVFPPWHRALAMIWRS